MTDQNEQTFKALKKQLSKWKKDKMEPLWTEGQTWDTITWMIHQDLFLNRDVRVKNSGQLQEYRNQK